ncbi:MAG: tripartite tricarboxylate transporter substrate binding protein [Hyphomicrobiaceae bacterium]
MIDNSVKPLLLVASFAIGLAGQASLYSAAAKFPDKPIELVCTTKPGSGAARWCQMMAEELKKPEQLGTPINVIFKSGGSNHEPTLYVANKPADGYTLLHVSASFKGYFNLPHYQKTFDDFVLLGRVEKHLYGIAVRCDDPDIKSWKDLVNYAKANPGKLAMGSNKVGSNHHRHHVALYSDLGLNVRFIPYRGTGGVVKDVVGKHLRVGFAQPGKWNSHIKAGTICPLALLNETRLGDPQWKDVPAITELGAKYTIPHQWQGFMVRKGTPEEAMNSLASAFKAVTLSAAYKEYLSRQPHVVAEFHGDRQKLDSYFRSGLDEARAFMIKHKIIKP